ncbi:hypothetical protein DMQ71_21325 [Klebsiella quasipneumoniae]|nr:hypothetical protein DMQ71_21325 [Klebsiella quasipneumoniae]
MRRTHRDITYPDRYCRSFFACTPTRVNSKVFILPVSSSAKIKKLINETYPRTKPFPLISHIYSNTLLNFDRSIPKNDSLGIKLPPSFTQPITIIC